MKTQKLLNHYAAASMLLCLGVSNIQIVSAATANLSDTPLFLTTHAESNMFFIYDDSGSMASEMLTPQDNGDLGGVYCHENTSPDPATVAFNTKCAGGSGTSLMYIYAKDTKSFPAGQGIVGKNSAGKDVPINNGDGAPVAAWYLRSHDYNAQYYNPNTVYKPWPPSSNATTTTFYPNSSPTAAPVSPLSTTVVDLTRTDWSGLTGIQAAHYYTWKDTNGDGLPTSGEGTLVQISTPTELQNFANWFTYYRTRSLAARGSVGSVISDIGNNVQMRVGFMAINDGSNNTKMTSISTPNNTDPSSPGVKNRRSVLNSLYKLSAANGTPLLDSLQKAGNYFACDGNATPFTTSDCALDPAVKACQQNFIVMITDGEYNGSYTAAPGRDIADNLISTSPRAGDTAFDGDPYASNASNTLADLAMYYYEHDLDGNNMNNQVPTVCGVDENAGQHAVFYALSFGISTDIIQPPFHPQLNIAPNNCTVTTIPDPYNYINPKTGLTASISGWKTSGWPWKDATTDPHYRINDLVHATFNGRGKYYPATSPELLVAGLKDTVSNINSRRGAAAAVGLNSTSNTTGTQVYFARFYSGNWFGELSADTLDPLTGALIAHAWDAHGTTAGLLNTLSNDQVRDPDNDSILVAPAPAPTGYQSANSTSITRAVVTFNPGAIAAPYGIGFHWTKLASAQKDDLRTNSSGTLDPDAIAQMRLNYIRGDHRCETGYTTDLTRDRCPDAAKIFRTRKDNTSNFTRLGDFINSSPIYVGTPVGGYPNTAPFPTGGDTYQNFKDGVSNAAFSSVSNNAKTRTPMLYLGGNDGMLHGFNTTSGQEVFAYIPNTLFAAATPVNGADGLHKLTEAGQHRSYVDLTPTIADAYTETPSDPTKKWRSILVGGLRHGGKGIYALDITDPDYLISATGSIREDHTAEKVMWEFNDATSPGNMGYSYSQPVIAPLRIGSGNTVNDIAWFAIFGNGYNSTNGNAILYLVKLSGPSGTGSVYTIDTGVGNPASTSGVTPNGLSSPAVIDVDGDGIYDRVYAGDLYGNMWVFNLAGLPSSWTNTAASTLFTAKNGSGEVQPITVKPVVMRNTATASGTAPNLLVLFGTGQYMAEGDQTSTSTQSFYGVWDNGTRNLTRTDLQSQLITTVNASFNVTTTTTTTKTIRILNNGSVDYTTKHGWSMDFDPRERIVSKATLLGNTLIFPTIVPSDAGCGGGGTSWLMAVNPLNGNTPGISVFDVNGDHSIGNPDDYLAPGGSSPQIIAGLQNPNMTPDYAYAAPSNTASGNNPKPCAKGSYIQAIGTATNATTTAQSMCVEGGSGKPGRYSWHQVGF
ncbi:MAG: hypothetical protein HY080_01115 [Gammaproteobacteria bacterium]|nr:hypothetical protein [Gammaproteobacteria bacterium]